MDRKTAKLLIDKYLAGQCSAEEQAQVETWYNQLAEEQKDKLESINYDALNARIKAGLPPDPVMTPTVVRLWPRFFAAASIVLVLGIGLYYFNQTKRPEPPVQMAHNDIAPGSNKATLTLANGKLIVLTDAHNGTLAAQGSTAITKKADGKIIYIPQEVIGEGGKELAYNTVSTPRGGQYQVVLPDGSQVWLNAASSIRFPTTFSGSDREVTITGEAYFEVAHNKLKPFRVSVNGQTVEVLGTHFNINAYTDESEMKTTLFEGSVRVRSTNNHSVLKPGQQALVKNNRIHLIENPDLDEVIAWHKGMFQFHSADMKTVLRQLGRWYDVDFVYNAQIADRHFSGELFRNDALKISDILTFEKINFRMEGKKITIIP